MPNLVECRELRQKMRFYFYISSPGRKGATPIEGRAELGRFLGVDKAQVGRWLDGSERTQPDRFRSDHLERLCEQVTILTGGRLAKDEAWALWVDRTAEEFERQIRRPDTPDFVELLARKEPMMKVRIGLPVDSLGAFEEPFTPLPEDHIIRVGEAFRVEVEVTLGRCLVLIGSSPEGWFWFSPSKWHSGMCKTRKVIVPPASGFAVTTNGPHRLIAVEMEKRTPPHVRGHWDSMVMEGFMRQALAEDIADCEPISGWRWGESRFYADRG